MSDVDLEEELLAVAGRGGKKRSRPRPDDADEDFGSFQQRCSLRRCSQASKRRLVSSLDFVFFSRVQIC